MSKRALIFDLDGTLSDPYVGISRSYLYALEAIGRDAISESELRDMIGPPIQIAFARLCGDEPHLIAEAVRAYRERYADVGLFENTVYPEIPETIAALARSYTLYVCTSKPTTFAERILAHFGLATYFAAIDGISLDVTSHDKTTLLATLLEREGVAAADAIMIGDRTYDAEAAHNIGTDFIGVLWGFGNAAEFQAAGATTYVGSPAELAAEIAAISAGKRR
jgi:phosphoglycolate phosphatase